MKAFRLACVATTLAVASACTWVEPTSGGKSVTVAKPEHVATCQRLGQTNTTTKARVGFIVRNREKVATELATLARNDAAAMGGDTVVAQNAPMDGTQSFAIYRCR